MNIIILHSLNGDTIKTWGQDIKNKFENNTINVYMPEFPIRENSSYEKFKEILDEYLNEGILNSENIIICHSIGNPYFIRYAMENNYKPKAYIAVAPGAIYEYPMTRNDYIVEVKKQAYLKKEHLDYIKELNIEKYCFYSDEDDNNKEKFERFIKDTNAKEIYLKGYNHFDGYHNINEIPELNSLLEKFI